MKKETDFYSYSAIMPLDKDLNSYIANIKGLSDEVLDRIGNHDDAYRHYMR